MEDLDLLLTESIYVDNLKLTTAHTFFNLNIFQHIKAYLQSQIFPTNLLQTLSVHLFHTQISFKLYLSTCFKHKFDSLNSLLTLDGPLNMFDVGFIIFILQ